MKVTVDQQITCSTQSPGHLKDHLEHPPPHTHTHTHSELRVADNFWDGHSLPSLVISCMELIFRPPGQKVHPLRLSHPGDYIFGCLRETPIGTYLTLPPFTSGFLTRLLQLLSWGSNPDFKNIYVTVSI